jgi:RNA polymerase sigma-70 factor (ECF subfamily)
LIIINRKEEHMSEAYAHSPAQVIERDGPIHEISSNGRNVDLAEMVRIYRPRLLKVAFRILKNSEDAEDAVQDTFMNAFAHVENFRGDSLLSTWLTRIVMNQALMELRRKKRRPSDSLDEEIGAEISMKEMLTSNAPSSETLLLEAEKREHLRHAVARLPKRLRIVTIEQLIYERSIAEISQQYGISQSATKSRLLRARLALKAGITRRTPVCILYQVP